MLSSSVTPGLVMPAIGQQPRATTEILISVWPSGRSSIISSTFQNPFFTESMIDGSDEPNSTASVHPVRRFGKICFGAGAPRQAKDRGQGDFAANLVRPCGNGNNGGLGPDQEKRSYSPMTRNNTKPAAMISAIHVVVVVSCWAVCPWAASLLAGEAAAAGSTLSPDRQYVCRETGVEDMGGGPGVLVQAGADHRRRLRPALRLGRPQLGQATGAGGGEPRQAAPSQPAHLGAALCRRDRRARQPRHPAILVGPQGRETLERLAGIFPHQHPIARGAAIQSGPGPQQDPQPAMLRWRVLRLLGARPVAGAEDGRAARRPGDRDDQRLESSPQGFRRISTAVWPRTNSTG